MEVNSLRSWKLKWTLLRLFLFFLFFFFSFHPLPLGGSGWVFFFLPFLPLIIYSFSQTQGRF